jgi:hypothetical protein
MTCRR